MWSLKDTRPFVQKHGQRKVTAQLNKYTGKVVADEINHRRATHLISFVEQPSKTATETYTCTSSA